MVATPVIRKLAQLDDVAITSPADGDLAQYNAASGKWKNVPGGTQPVINVAEQYGTTAAAINQAIADANANAFALGGAPVTVFLDSRDWILEAEIAPQSYVSLVGAGRGKTILLPAGTNAGIHGVFTNGSPLSYWEMADLTIDGTNQSGTYTSAIKGVFIQYLLNCGFRRLEILNAYATGLGVDFLRASEIEDVITRSCGRGNGGTDPGGNGIGIGIGHSIDEFVNIRGCKNYSATRYGLLLERQNSASSEAIGYSIVGCHSESCAVGFGDGGAHGANFDTCTALANTIGMQVGQATISQSSPGWRGRINNCIVLENTSHGIVYDASLAAPGGPDYAITNNTVIANLGDGIAVLLASVGDVGKMTIANNKSQSNGPSSGSGSNAGIHCSTSGTSKLTDLTIFGNDLGDDNRYGILIQCSVSHGRIQSNRCYDSGSGKQTNGLALGSTYTMTNVVFDGNDVSQVTTPVLLNATMTGCFIGNNPGWTAPFATVVSKTGTYTAKTTDELILGDATSAAFTVTLPTAVGITGKRYIVKKTDSGGNAVTIGTTSSQTIDGSTTQALSSQYDALTVVSDGAGWQIIGDRPASLGL